MSVLKAYRPQALMLLLAALFQGGRAQDTQFTQFYSSPMFIAPSYAGGVVGHRAVANYRAQWASVPKSYQTYSVSWDHNIASFKSGVGVLAIRDVAGAGNLSNTRLGALYSYDITPLADIHVRPGVGFYVQQLAIDFNRLTFFSQLVDGGGLGDVTQPGRTSSWDIDVSASVIVFGDNYWGGFTWDHMLRPNNTFYGDDGSRTAYKFSFYGGYRFIMRGFLLTKVDESITLLFNYRAQDIYKQLDLGLNWYRKPLTVGVWWRGLFRGEMDQRVDALAFMVGYRFQAFSVGYSYDFTVSRLGLGSGGSHEISLVYEFKSKARKKWKAIPCPTF